MKTFEQVIRDNKAAFGHTGSEYVVRVQHDLEDDGLVIYIRPQDRDGETVEFIVCGNHVETVDENVLNDIQKIKGYWHPTKMSLVNTNKQLSKMAMELTVERNALKERLLKIGAILKSPMPPLTEEEYAKQILGSRGNMLNSDKGAQVSDTTEAS